MSPCLTLFGFFNLTNLAKSIFNSLSLRHKKTGNCPPFFFMSVVRASTVVQIVQPLYREALVLAWPEFTCMPYHFLILINRKHICMSDLGIFSMSTIEGELLWSLLKRKRQGLLHAGALHYLGRDQPDGAVVVLRNPASKVQF